MRYKEGDIVGYRGFEIRRSSNDAFGRWFFRPAGGPVDEAACRTLAEAKRQIRCILNYYRTGRE